MKKVILINIVFVMLIFTLIGCDSKDESASQVLNEINEPENIVQKVEDVEQEKNIIDSTESNSDFAKIEQEEKIQSIINGTYINEEKFKLRPFAVMLDNEYNARPQAGLDEADLVYEFLVEGPITRYMAVFQSNAPELIGPVRSARPYFIYKALEFECLYVHDGGSEQAKQEIKEYKVADIDAYSRDKRIFWRKKHKSAPHNEYTSTDAIRLAAKESKYKTQVDFDSWKFNKKNKNINGDEANHIKIPYTKNYIPSFKYDEKKELYLRYINDKPHVDEKTNNNIYAKNIIIQKADTKIIDSVGRRSIEIVGSGEGYYLTNGKKIEIKWKKDSINSLTKFYNIQGNEIKLNPGVIWVEVIPSSKDIVFE